MNYLKKKSTGAFPVGCWAHAIALPDSGIVKVGRTSNWWSRRKTYMRGNPGHPDTAGVMQLLKFHYTDPKGVANEDTSVREWVMACYEDAVKKLANESQELEPAREIGIEYYRLTGDLDLFLQHFQKRFGSTKLSEVLSLRSDSRLREHCKRDRMRSFDKMRQELDRLIELNE